MTASSGAAGKSHAQASAGGRFVQVDRSFRSNRTQRVPSGVVLPAGVRLVGTGANPLRVDEAHTASPAYPDPRRTSVLA
jgi:hypothetical protein